MEKIHRWRERGESEREENPRVEKSKTHQKFKRTTNPQVARGKWQESQVSLQNRKKRKE